MSAILALNAGSSSLKWALFDPERVAGGKIEGAADLEAVLAQAGRRPDAVGHRIVHGGPRYLAPARIDAALLAELRRISPFDPEHLPAEIALVEAVERRFPGLPQVACFDTAFHKDLPREARLLPIPREYEARGVRRYGFHGLSYAHVVDVLRREPGGLPRRVVIAHLGSGASLAAVLDGRSVDTTMAFTPGSGVPMGRRSGDLDPGLVAYLGLTPEAWHEMTTARSGLLGISETSGDVRELLGREAKDVRAAEALAVFVRRVKQAVGAFAATLGGLDLLVFTGGIGENSEEIRARILEGLEFLVRRTRVIRADEESRIGAETREVLGC